MNHHGDEPGVDPVSLELFRNLVEASAEEMGYALQRTSFSANIKERRDFSCALFLPDATLLAQAAHIPVHLGAMPESVRAVIDDLGTLGPGDVAIVNDPYRGGSHLPDITLVTPVYLGRTLLGYAANRAHHADVGGETAGSMTLSTHIDQEGVRIAPALLYRDHRRDEALLRRLLSAVRTPDERLGDLEAQLTANRVGAAALARIAAGQGVEATFRHARALVSYAARLMQSVLAGIKPGNYTAQEFLDDDGINPEPLSIRVALGVERGPGGVAVTVDLRDSAPHAAGPLNCPAAVTRSAVYYCFCCLLDSATAGQAPLNAGCFRDIAVLTRPGSLLDAAYPAPVVAGNTETSQRVVDAVFAALAEAMPGHIPAASCGSMSSLALGGDEPHRWTYYETIGGGCGAGPLGDGESAIQCHMTNTLSTPAEALEIQYPLRVVRFERATSTGGSGTHTGGDGIVREIMALRACSGTLLTDRRVIPPPGLGGASAGRQGQNQIIRGNGLVEPLPGKCRFDLAAGDRIRIVTPGGGGWNPPTPRARG